VGFVGTRQAKRNGAERLEKRGGEKVGGGVVGTGPAGGVGNGEGKRVGVEAGNRGCVCVSCSVKEGHRVGGWGGRLAVGKWNVGFWGPAGTTTPEKRAKPQKGGGRGGDRVKEPNKRGEKGCWVGMGNAAKKKTEGVCCRSVGAVPARQKHRKRGRRRETKKGGEKVYVWWKQGQAGQKKKPGAGRL